MTHVLILVILAAVPAFGQEKSPSLDDTLRYMQNTLSQYGYIHTEGKDQELTMKGDEPCRIYVEWEMTVKMHKPQDGKYPVEYQINLGTIDPDSLKVTTDESQKNKPEGWKLTKVHLSTTKNESTIWMSGSEWKESKKVPKSLQLSVFPEFDFQFRDKEQAERFSKALKHAVILCGGKPSAF